MTSNTARTAISSKDLAKIAADLLALASRVESGALTSTEAANRLRTLARKLASTAGR